MYKIVLLSVIVMFVMAGEAYPGTEVFNKGVEVYTFKRKRVDQDLVGNRGYLSGKPEHVPSKTKSDERTMIGIDVMLPTSLYDVQDYEREKSREKGSRFNAVSKKNITFVSTPECVCFL